MSGDTIRLDKWLWFARFRKSRALASEFCAEGRIRVNRTPVSKPATTVKIGDVVTLPLGPEIRVVRVLALGVRRGPPTEARTLYEEVAGVDHASAKC